MIKIYDNGFFDNHKVGSYLFALMLGCLNPETNRLELNGEPLNSIDLCAYANLTMQELSLAVKELIKLGAIIMIRGKGKEFYYANPKYIRDNQKRVSDFEWLMSIFNEKPNLGDKNLVYFKKRNKKITVSIGEPVSDID